MGQSSKSTVNLIEMRATIWNGWCGTGKHGEEHVSWEAILHRENHVGNLGGGWVVKVIATDLVIVNGLWTKFYNGSTFVTVDRGYAPILHWCEFRGVPVWCLGYPLAWSLRIVWMTSWLSAENNNFLALACFACLSSLLCLGCSKRKKSSSVTSSSHSSSTSDVSQTPCGPPTLSVSQDGVTQDKHVQRRFGILSLHLALAGKL